MSAKGQDFLAGLRPDRHPTKPLQLVGNDHALAAELAFQTDLARIDEIGNDVSAKLFVTRELVYGGNQISQRWGVFAAALLHIAFHARYVKQGTCQSADNGGWA